MRPLGAQPFPGLRPGARPMRAAQAGSCASRFVREPVRHSPDPRAATARPAQRRRGTARAAEVDKREALHARAAASAPRTARLGLAVATAAASLWRHQGRVPPCAAPPFRHECSQCPCCHGTCRARIHGASVVTRRRRAGRGVSFPSHLAWRRLCGCGQQARLAPPVRLETRVRARAPVRQAGQKGRPGASLALERCDPGFSSSVSFIAQKARQTGRPGAACNFPVNRQARSRL